MGEGRSQILRGVSLTDHHLFLSDSDIRIRGQKSLLQTELRLLLRNPSCTWPDENFWASNGEDGRPPLLSRTSPWSKLPEPVSSTFVIARLFDYIQGKNEYSRKIEMTAPVITQISPSDGPFCTSSFVVSFYVPKENQAGPPPAKGLHVQRWNSTYVAVRQFGGFVQDSDVGEEAAALEASLSGTVWAKAIKETHAGETTLIYTVAQYNSPFEFSHRVNEIWMSFDIDDAGGGGMKRV